MALSTEQQAIEDATYAGSTGGFDTGVPRELAERDADEQALLAKGHTIASAIAGDEG